MAVHGIRRAVPDVIGVVIAPFIAQENQWKQDAVDQQGRRAVVIGISWVKRPEGIDHHHWKG